MKLAIIYNTCGLSGLESFEFYRPAIDSLLTQDLDDCQVVVSDCLGSARNRNALLDCYGDKLSYCFIDDKHPVPVTFNTAVLEYIKKFGPAEGYLYVDSGIILNGKSDVRKLYDLFKSGPYAMVSSSTDHDTGYFFPFGLGSHPGDVSEDRKLFKDGDFVIPVGKAVNLHCQIFSHDLISWYDRPYTDIWASHCSESVFSFMCAAIDKKWIVSKDVIAHHRYLHGNASSVARNENNVSQGRPHWDHPYIINSIQEAVFPGYHYGLGMEEIHGVLMHDPDKFDKDGYAKDVKLAPYIQDHLFLPNYLLDYDKINYTWI